MYINENNNVGFFEDFFLETEIPERFWVLHQLIYRLKEEKTRDWNVSSLENYLKYVYKRILKYEDRYLKKEGDLVAFNTGLMNKYNKEIYFIGILEDVNLETNYKPIDEPKDYYGFVTVDDIERVKKNEKSYKEIINNTERITFSDNGSFFHNYKKPIEIKFKEQNWKHIIQDGINNFPPQFLSKYFLNIDFEFINYENKCKIKSKLKDTNTPEFIFLKKIIEKATNNSLEMYKHDDSLIAQIYYAKHDTLSYLIPLYILQSEKPDMVLLFNVNDYEKTINKIFDDRDLNEKILSPIGNKNQIKIKAIEIYNQIKPEKEDKKGHDFIQKKKKEIIAHREHLKDNQIDMNGFFNVITVLKILSIIPFSNYIRDENSMQQFFELLKYPEDDFNKIFESIKEMYQKETKEMFVASTILNMSEAYQNLRLFGDIRKYHWLL